ncbi:MAG TPA: enoyl-CoA hydratase-related protein, partial [Steroidobacteraceae bacterium]|nr:enoyl-CoA hydratase-related protein [Steroidobacteraceae bacterium]
MSELVAYKRTGAVAQVVMDDGKVNVMSSGMLRALLDAFERAEKDGAIVMLTSGRPGIFSAGFDTKLLARRNPPEVYGMVKLGAELAARVLSFPNPVVAACTGHAAETLQAVAESTAAALCAIDRGAHATTKERLRRGAVSPP